MSISLYVPASPEYRVEWCCDYVTTSVDRSYQLARLAEVIDECEYDIPIISHCPSGVGAYVMHFEQFIDYIRDMDGRWSDCHIRL